MKALIKKGVSLPQPLLKPTKPMRVYMKSEMTIPKRFEDERPELHPVRNGRDSWTEAETKAVLDMWAEGQSIEKIAKMLGRTEGSVEGRINREREKGHTERRKSDRWTEKDDELLKRMHSEGKKLTAIAKEMHRSLSTVQRHIAALRKRGEV